jgi:hypothetical protein
MDPTVKHWVGLWDYLDGNFWGFWQWAASRLSPDEVSWQPSPHRPQKFNQGGPVQATPLGTMRPGSLDDSRHRDLTTIASYHRQVRP